MDIDTEVSTVLATIRSKSDNSELNNIIYQLEDFYERKLWHQLTQVLDQIYYTLDSTIITSNLKNRLYNLFIKQFQLKLNPIKVVDYLLESFENDPKETLSTLLTLKKDFINDLKRSHNYRVTDDVDDNDDNEEEEEENQDEELKQLIQDDEAVIYVKLQIARYYLKLHQLNKAEDILIDVAPKFESLNNNLNSKINSAYYLEKTEHAKILNNYNDYYSNGLLYLSSVTNLTDEEKNKLRYELCIAALLGDKIYNFGELILHDIFQEISQPSSSTTSSQYNWLYQLIINLNAGNVDNFNHWLSIAIKKAPILEQHQIFLKEKLTIMALLELVSADKKLSFDIISEKTNTPIDQVELIIIKTMSLHLIEGYINQDQQYVVVSWIQPRILNLDQVKNLIQNVEHLSKNISLVCKNF
ncbi:proteasome regulatory particle lid subunit [Candida albicans SC5314]|uniref:Proteasome regulatory particle lid subunit n=1 Tax=Candida albicans (strain SC5314 / ATCC MYA-2876) TaxID=237561 RepID=A0A1D8PGA6_CANAL|nr:proteasome regulatory particle lid subunit [Candida albicans SC5314]AOW27178.1 proteasome regulatory particle lid subunit [Candida albicans SC5314]|eukprot:XP_719443.2 proteasome regulatory particle lid subunit [Candida albicans SC5314]